MTDEKFAYAVQTISNSVSTIDVAKRIGVQMDNANRCKCPFHGGVHNNLKLYDGNNGFFCFVCHQSGTSIDLAKKLLNCSYMDAMKWINKEFSIGVDLDERSFYARKKRVPRREKK